MRWINLAQDSDTRCALVKAMINLQTSWGSSLLGSQEGIWLVGWLVGWLVDLLIDWLASRQVRQSVGRSVGQSVSQSGQPKCAR
jgi:hypothetical protein